MKPTIRVLSLSCAVALTAVRAPAGDSVDPSFQRSLTLAPAEASSSGAGDDEAARQAELVKKTLNPIASLISVPFQNNWDFGIGPSDAMAPTGDSASR